MLEISNLALPLDAGLEGKQADKLVRRAAARALNIPPNDITEIRLLKRSVDARKKHDVHFVATLGVELAGGAQAEAAAIEAAALRKGAANMKANRPYAPLRVPQIGDSHQAQNEPRPIVVGTGPAGWFCALYLARAGLRPLVVERGAAVDERMAAVDAFNAGEPLDPHTNIQYGEGGAGTFSDGKLTTGIKDFRIRKVLEEFHKHGAPKEILYYSKPHVGTDNLSKMVASIRSEIRKLGGEVRFSNKLVNVKTDNGEICGAVVESDSGEYVIETNNIVLAIGHSARDTFLMLQNRNIAMEQKSFSVGARIEHSQEMINKSQYGKAYKKLPAADYKMAVHLESGRGVYTFCMCPGGRVVASASEDGGVVTNGMSYFARDGKNANSALLVNVTPSDFKTEDPLAGMYFQREIEQRAFEVGGKNYNAPCQRVGDFLGTESNSEYTVEPTYKPNVTWVNLDEVFPKFITDSMREGIVLMDNKLHGFADSGAVITGPETRSSSPVRIIRDKKTMQSNIKGLYPCGEGAGYAGGIMSAAVDGIKIAEMVAINNGRGKNEQ